MDQAEAYPTSSPNTSPQLDAEERPSSAGLAAEPTPSALLQAHRSEAFQQPRPRNRSPYSRSHWRSYSAASALAAPAMARTRSLPNTAAGFYISPSHSPLRPSSPLRSPGATRPNPRRSFEDTYPHMSTPSFMEIESIAEDSELDITPRPSLQTESSPAAGALSLAPSPSFSRGNNNNSTTSRRRPNSPLHSLAQSPVPPHSSPLLSFPSASTSTTTTTSPSLTQPSPSSTPPPSRFNEVYPGTMTMATPHLTLSTAATGNSNSSYPSTPTSLRSRSPSISSLETIPDSPDAEEAAIEAFNIARLKAAAEAADAIGSDSDGEGARRASTSSAMSSRSSLDKSRKRWSVCGAERRGDFEMETIWED